LAEGINSLEDMRTLFKMGVDKVSINTAAVKNPELIALASKEFVKNKLVVAIDGKRTQKVAQVPVWKL
jgi:cyclase